MPTKETDPSCNGKKLHIGNDDVIVVYNESGEEYNMQTVKVRLAFIFLCFCSE
jgi:tuberous sclerosis protein 2